MKNKYEIGCQVESTGSSVESEETSDESEESDEVGWIIIFIPEDDIEELN